MNLWMERSIDFANSRDYLDELFNVYPMPQNSVRGADDDKRKAMEKVYNEKDDKVVSCLPKLELLLKDNFYVECLKRDSGAIKRNPETAIRVCKYLFFSEQDVLKEQCAVPKEANRQIQPLFMRWMKSNALGVTPCKMSEFTATNDDAILDASDAEMQQWAQGTVGYERNKGLDFVARFNGKYVIGEAKFLTDWGGHQNAQLVDALDTLHSPTKGNVVRIAILDGVVWLKGGNKMYTTITQEYANENIMSALVLSDFLYSL